MYGRYVDGSIIDSDHVHHTPHAAVEVFRALGLLAAMYPQYRIAIVAHMPGWRWRFHGDTIYLNGSGPVGTSGVELIRQVDQLLAEAVDAFTDDLPSPVDISHYRRRGA